TASDSETSAQTVELARPCRRVTRMLDSSVAAKRQLRFQEDVQYQAPAPRADPKGKCDRQAGEERGRSKPLTLRSDVNAPEIADLEEMLCEQLFWISSFHQRPDAEVRMQDIFDDSS
ncbi:unnamed protein product, partial [Polarella glacialis]